jgi:hypothetical protein
VKAKELIGLLQSEADPETEVFLSSDEEGSAFYEVSPDLGMDGSRCIVIYPEGRPFLEL